MKVLKGCALAFLSFILFLSLCIFGIAFTVNQVVLNPHTIEKILNDVDFSQIIQETISEQNTGEGSSAELQTALIATLKKMEPVIKQRIGIAIEDTYAYLAGKGDVPDLKGTLGKSVMTSQFVSDLLDQIDLSNLLDQVMKEQAVSGTNQMDAFSSALVAVVDQSESLIKQELVDASDPIFKYLLMQNSSIDLRSTLRQTILSDTTVNTMLNNFDYTMMTKNILTQYLGQQLPQGINLSSDQIDRVVTVLKPSVKTALTNASGSFADYLTGAKSRFSIIISLQPAVPTMKTVIKEAYLAQLPANLQGLSQTQINSAFEQYYTDFAKTIPSDYEVNSSDLGISPNTNLTKAITNAQNNLTQARNNLDEASRNFEDNLQQIRTYVGYFRLGFACLIALIILLIAGIILIYRNVKDCCRNLGIVFFIYGLGAFAVVVAAKFIAAAQIAKADIPQAMSKIPGILLNDVLSPLQIFSLVCLIGGLIAIIISFIYPKLKPAKTDQATLPAANPK
jgi:hypothetical protein